MAKLPPLWSTRELSAYAIQELQTIPGTPHFRPARERILSKTMFVGIHRRKRAGVLMLAYDRRVISIVLDRWGQSGDPKLTTTVALYVWSVADPGVYNSHGMSGDDYYVAPAPVNERGTILANLVAMRQEAAVNAVTDPALSLSIAMSAQYASTLTVGAHPASLPGPRGGDGCGVRRRQFIAHAGRGAAPARRRTSAPSYRIEASMSVAAAGYGPVVRRADKRLGHQHTLGHEPGGGLRGDLGLEVQLDHGSPRLVEDQDVGLVKQDEQQLQPSPLATGVESWAEVNPSCSSSCPG